MRQNGTMHIKPALSCEYYLSGLVADSQKFVTISSGKSHAVPFPANWIGNGVRSNRVFYR